MYSGFTIQTNNMSFFIFPPFLEGFPFQFSKNARQARGIISGEIVRDLLIILQKISSKLVK